MTPSGVVGGGQIGYNYQITPMFVAGIEADIQAADMGSTVKYATANLSGNGYTAINNAKNVDWFGTARARIGVVVPGYSNFLVYGTGGFAYGYVNNTYDNQYGCWRQRLLHLWQHPGWLDGRRRHRMVASDLPSLVGKD